MPRNIMFVTGPSRSADIEQTLELGAHGPRRLHIILVDDDPAALPMGDAAVAPPVAVPGRPRRPRRLSVAWRPGRNRRGAPAPARPPGADRGRAALWQAWTAARRSRRCRARRWPPAPLRPRRRCRTARPAGAQASPQWPPPRRSVIAGWSCRSAPRPAGLDGKRWKRAAPRPDPAGADAGPAWPPGAGRPCRGPPLPARRPRPMGSAASPSSPARARRGQEIGVLRRELPYWLNAPEMRPPAARRGASSAGNPARCTAAAAARGHR